MNLEVGQTCKLFSEDETKASLRDVLDLGYDKHITLATCSLHDQVVINGLLKPVI